MVTIETRSGRISGVERNGVWSFSGVPYAAAPEGSRRWRPPVSPRPWAGIRVCDHFTPTAPQPPMIPGLSIAGEPDEHSEDCLSLNLWTPGIDGGRRPVMVWVHGGGFTAGSGAGNLYRGGGLAREADVVVVTINYRLGALGFLAHPTLEIRGEPWLGGDSWAGFGNWGLADQVAALVWVRDHIALFGGDPGNVTVFGESAGGMSVAALLAMPAARGLFHRAVVESGPPYTQSADRAAERAELVAAGLGVALTRESLEGVPADELVRAVTAVGSGLRTGDGLPLPLLPVVDGGLLGVPPEEAVADGSAADVPLLIGTNRDEAAFFAVGMEQVRSLDDAGLRHWVARVVPDPADVERLVDAYTEARTLRRAAVTPRDLWVAIASDVIFRLPSLRLADAHHRSIVQVGPGPEGPPVGPAVPGSSSAAVRAGTFVYLFTQETPAFGGVLGACHGLEIPFVFGTVRNPGVQLFSGGGDDALQLSATMRRAWASFARDGDPGGGSEDDAAGAEVGRWSPWTPGRRPTTVLGPWPGDRSMVRSVERPHDAELVALADALAPGTVSR